MRPSFFEHVSRDGLFVHFNDPLLALFIIAPGKTSKSEEAEQARISSIFLLSAVGTLLREVAARQQHAAPEHPIVLEGPPVEQGVPILADAGRITYVLTTYLTNAGISSPPGRPVEVHVRVENALTRVSVHNEGAGIAREDLDHLWERFYRAKGSAVQHGLDLSRGLPLYL